MCRRSSSAIIAWLAAIVAVLAGTVESIADDVADYLERHGLKTLLATHLEQQMAQMKPEDRGDLALRLGSVYADLLESANDPDLRRDLEQRSRALLDAVPTAGAEELRLALLRTSYRAAEKIAENYRLRLSSEADVQIAKDRLAEIAEQAGALRQRLKHAAELSDRRLSRSSGSQAIQIGEAGDRAHMLLTQCTFLNAWALYYQSWLNQRDAEARLAEPLFAELLQTESELPQPADVSEDLRASEAVARSVLGMALCKSLTASAPTAISWLRLLEHENTHEALRSQAVAWMIAVYLDHREYQQVRDLLDERAEADIPTTWLRLIAVHALEGRSNSAIAADLAPRMVLGLASRGELTQVLDLANRYGIDALANPGLGSAGFALQYVRGVLKFQEARTAHGAESPTLEQRLVSLYGSAGDQLQAAVAEPDAGRYEVPASSCRRLIAWCFYFRSEFLAAADAFDQASSQLTGSESAESLWMAIVALNTLNESSSVPSIQVRLAELTDRFVTQFPSDERAATLRLRRAIASDEISEQVADELLAIPSNSEAFDPAQRRAADVLYELFRSASPDQRPWLAGRFLSIVVPTLNESSREVERQKGAAAVERFIVRCRQTLELALAEGVQRADAAREALAAVQVMRDVEGVNWSSIQDEIDCRRVQERLLANDVSSAAGVADEMWNRTAESLWTRLATRAMFTYGHEVWKEAVNETKPSCASMEIVAKYGGRVLHEFRTADDPLAPRGSLAYHVAVAEASMQLWQEYGDTERGQAALYLYERMLAARPRHAAFLRSTAVLSEKFGEQSRALECWRRLVAGTEAGTSDWYEAKVHVIQILSVLDPLRAREVMEQHKQLNPDYGPDPWGGILKGLDAQIPSASPAAPSSLGVPTRPSHTEAAA